MFSRKRGGPKHVRATDAPPSEALAQSLAADDDGPAPDHGPYDEKHAPAGVQRLDLGSLWIPAVEGVESGCRPTRTASSSRSCSWTATAPAVGCLRRAAYRGDLERGAGRDRPGDGPRTGFLPREVAGPYASS